MISLLSTFGHGELCFELSDLLFKTLNNDSRVDTLVSRHFVLDDRHVSCKSTRP
jgi:hypothetical protein